jgi:hypothetical protein
MEIGRMRKMPTQEIDSEFKLFTIIPLLLFFMMEFNMDESKSNWGLMLGCFPVWRPGRRMTQP